MVRLPATMERREYGHCSSRYKMVYHGEDALKEGLAYMAVPSDDDETTVITF